MPRVPGEVPPKAPDAKVSTAPAAEVSPGHEAVALVLAPLKFREAPRIGVVGDSGTGKSTAEKYIVAGYLDAEPRGLAVAVDDKSTRAQFGGQLRRDVAHVKTHRLLPTPRVVSFRGDVVAGYQVDRDTVSAFAWRLSVRGIPTLTIHDELSEAAKNGQWKRGVIWIPKSFGQGRVIGCSQLWGTQSPQSVPMEAFEQSSAILCFRLSGIGLSLLRRRGYLDGGAADVVPMLGGDELPPAQRGRFVVLLRGRPWNGKIYRFGPRPEPSRRVAPAEQQPPLSVAA